MFNEIMGVMNGVIFDKSRLNFASRRSTIMAPNGAIATSQPLAVQAGLSILKRGGNAVDAAVATAAVLNVVEPGMTGIGGDVFAIVYDSSRSSLEGLNASGWSPRNATVEGYRRMGFKEMPFHGVFSITVPGALAGWEALLERLGTLSFKDVLEPAIKYARNGFPVSERIAWKNVESKLSQYPGGKEYLINDRAPKPGERFSQKNLASTFEAIAEGGAEVFYRGELSKKIIRFLKRYNSLMEEEDLSEFEPEWVQPLSVDYKGYTLYELPPNGQGLCALEALRIISNFNLEEFEFNSSEYLHMMIESMKLAFADGHHFITDPRFREIPVKRLLSEVYCRRRSELITDKAIVSPLRGLRDSDTSYLTVVDEDRNMVSFINSLYYPFGSGVVVEGTGIALQNRGSSFKLDEDHFNCLEPRKRPYHTIIPAMMYKEGKPYMSFGVMGGHMQPQGHLQVTSNIINFHMNPQDALDAPRFRFEEGNKVLLEDSIPAKVRKELQKKKHHIEVVNHLSTQFGGGQIIIIDPETGYLFAGSEPRKDGCALGY
jgi:gamma-glutamyltranspeptidase/glutathione hydrolase